MKIKRAVLLAGPALFAVALFVHVPEARVDATRVAGLALWMAFWWLSSVVPLEVTALLPIVVLPLAGIAPIGEVAPSYAHPIILLFMGGFFIAATLERWGLHRRFALLAVRAVGTGARPVLLAFMLVSAFASMWISNTAAAVMMLPIATAVTAGLGSEDDGFTRALMLGIAYACSIGGVATIIGTPPNAILAGTARELGVAEISFASWLPFGLLAAAPMLLFCWLLLARWFRVSGRVTSLSQLADHGDRRPLSAAEKFVLGVFVGTALAWIMRTPKELGGSLRIPGLTDLFPGISDAGIAIAASIILFVVPLKNARYSTALDWNTARNIQWGVLILFGGGLALASAFETSGLTGWIGGALAELQGLPLPLVILVSAAMFVGLTELTSNTATAALGMPLLAGAGRGLGLDPLPLMVAGAMGASMAFMLPVATPPNAILYSSGRISVRDMASVGVVLNILSVTVVSLLTWIWFG